MLAAATVLAFLVSIAVVHFLLRNLGGLALDQPNARSLHERPVPRTGGVAILLGAVVSIAFGAAELWLPVAIAFVLAAVSVVDDVRGVPTWLRLSAHAAAAGVLVWYVLSPMQLWELALLTIGVTWVINLYNFMDGSDGLAAGMSVIGFGSFGLAAYSADHLPLALVCFSLAFASLAFLLVNFHPARIFLGDVGSIPLGFLVGALGLTGWRDDVWPLWFPLLVFAVFIGDATLTLIKRLVRGERVWQAHREHYYQRMVRMGLGHRRTAYVCYALMAACAAAALYARGESSMGQVVVFVGAVAILSAVAVWVEVLWARHVRAAEGAR